jgi:subtilase family serine protease
VKFLTSMAALAAVGFIASGTAGATTATNIRYRHDVAASSSAWAATKTLAGVLANATDVGEVPASLPMTISVALTPSNLAGAKAYINREYTPGDPLFHHFLTPAQYTSNFGPTSAQAAAVANYLSAMGFTNISTAPNNVLVTATATAPVVERAFNTDIHAFNLGGQARYSNVSAAEVPTALAGAVSSVLGLHNNPMSTFLQFKTRHAVHRRFTPMQERSRRAAAIKGGKKIMSDTCVLQGVTFCVDSEFYTDDLEAFYDASTSKSASNTNIAIITSAQTGQLISDLRLNEEVNGLRQVPVTVTNVDPPNPNVVGADQIEFSMDTQTSTGIAGDAKGLYIYNTGGLTDEEISAADNRWVTDDIAPVASQSLGECEYNALTDGAMFAEDEIFIESMAQGQTMFASSGDGGASCAFTFVTNGLVNAGLEMVNYPASSTWVMGAGGTSAFANPDGSYNSEIAWAYSGGGVSLFENPGVWTFGVQPGWLPDYDGLGGAGAPAPGLGGGNLRSVPDVAMDADANVSAAIFYEYGASTLNGGTSLASPISAGAYARMQSAFNNTLGHAGPALYNHYKLEGGQWIGAPIECYGAALDGPPAICYPGAPTPVSLPVPPALTAPLAGFNDIVYGTNGLYPALPGYDLTTGMGSFDLNAMKISFGVQ